MAIQYLDAKRLRGTSTSVFFDSQAHANTASNGTTLTVDITIANNDNRILIVSAGSYNQSPTISGVTFGSQSLTKIDDDIIGSDGRSYLWYLLAPAVGTDTITVTWSGTAGRKGIGGMSFYNVAQTAPVNANTESSTSGTTAGGDVTPTTAGSMIVDGMLDISGSSSRTGNKTAGWTNFIGGSDRGQSSQYDLNPTIGSANTMNYTLGSGAGWAWVGCEVKCENQAKALPENTLFEEIDTRTYYILQSNEWKKMKPITPTWETDLSSATGWTNDNTSDLEVTGGVIQYKDNSYNLETTYYDMTAIDGITGGISDTAWVLRFKITLSGTADGSDEPLFGFHMTENGSQAVNDNADALGAYFYTDRSNGWRRIYGTCKADTTSVAGETFSPHGWGDWTAGTSFWVEYSRNGSTFTIKAFLTSDFNTQQTSNALNSPTMSVTIPSGVGTLRYLTAGHYSQGAGITVQIDDIQFWEGESEV